MLVISRLIFSVFRYPLIFFKMSARFPQHIEVNVDFQLELLLMITST